MPNERRDYAFGRSRLTILFGDLLDSRAEVLVSSDDYMLSMGGGISGAIGAAGGSALVLDAAKSVPRKLGDVVVTTAGALPARYIFHVVTIGDWDDHPSEHDPQQVIGAATEHCLSLLQPLGVTSIAFPALGTGAARFPVEVAAAGMVDVIAPFLEASSTHLTVELHLHARRGVNERDFIAFYEKLAARAPVLERKAVPVSGETPEEPRTGQRRSLALEQRRVELERELEASVAVGDETHVPAVLSELATNVQARAEAALLEKRAGKAAIDVFVSYAHEDVLSRDRLEKGLSTLRRRGLIREWHDRKIMPGANWNDSIDEAMSSAQMVLFLVSPDFIASEYIAGVEVRRAFELHAAGQLQIIPILIRPTYLQGDPLLELQALPTDAKPISTWSDQDEAYFDVVTGIARAVSALSGITGTQPA